VVEGGTETAGLGTTAAAESVVRVLARLLAGGRRQTDSARLLAGRAETARLLIAGTTRRLADGPTETTRTLTSRPAQTTRTLTGGRIQGDRALAETSRLGGGPEGVWLGGRRSRAAIGVRLLRAGGIALAVRLVDRAARTIRLGGGAQADASRAGTSKATGSKPASELAAGDGAAAQMAAG
jgi:hypothetical protein